MLKKDLGITSLSPDWVIVAFCTGGVAGILKLLSPIRIPGTSVIFVCRDDSATFELSEGIVVVAFFRGLAGGALGSLGLRTLLGFGASVLVAELTSPAFSLGFLTAFLRGGFSVVDAAGVPFKVE